MASGQVALANITLLAAQASVTFNNIPTTGFRDLRLVMHVFPGTLGAYSLRFNNDAGANYNWIRAYGTGSSRAADVGTNQSIGIWNFTVTSNGQSNQVDIFDYAQTDRHKNTLTRMDDAGAITFMIGSRWASMSAITQLNLGNNSGNFGVGSSFALYGVVS